MPTLPEHRRPWVLDPFCGTYFGRLGGGTGGGRLRSAVLAGRKAGEMLAVEQETGTLLLIWSLPIQAESRRRWRIA